MLKWRINNIIRWLCPECTKANAHLFLLYQHQWLGEETDAEAACDCCRCTRTQIERFGKLRWLLYPFLGLLPRWWPAPAKAMRRAK
ncbi:MAG: hypothetical protein ACOY3Z_10720 [Thermodesulfobacteriota bacterium]